jgi:hypothetical protein
MPACRTPGRVAISRFLLLAVHRPLASHVWLAKFGNIRFSSPVVLCVCSFASKALLGRVPFSSFLLLAVLCNCPFDGKALLGRVSFSRFS